MPDSCFQPLKCVQDPCETHTTKQDHGQKSHPQGSLNEQGHEHLNRARWTYDSSTHSYMGGCQNYGPFLGP